MKKPTIILILFILIRSTAISQTADSLRIVLKKTNYNDTNRVNLLLSIGETEGIFRISYWDSLKLECEQKLNSDSKNKNFYSKKLASIINDLGYVADEQGENKKALEAYKSGLKLYQQIGDKKGMAKAYNNIGTLYDDLGNLSLAIEYYYKSLEIRESIKDLSGLGSCHNNIGFLYFRQKNFSKALSSYKKAAAFSKSANNLAAYAVILGNIGLTYSTMNELDTALMYYMKGNKILNELNDPFNLCKNINNIAGIYKTQGKYEPALKLYERSLFIMDSLVYKRGAAVVHSNMADIYLKQGNISKAVFHGEKGMKLAREIGYPQEMSSTGLVLSRVYESTGNFKDAFMTYKFAKSMTDSIDKDDLKREAIQKDLQHEYDKKTAADSLSMVMERHSNELKIKEEKTKRFILYGGLVVILAFAIFVFNRLQVTRKQNLVISKQKTEVEEKNTQIVKQKELIEEKQKEIVDSINYAQRIQQAVLTGNDVWQNIANDHFILFKPKDIVSGDFYWATNIDNDFSIFALADCTGHGVPGGFMSMLGNSFLNEIVVEKKIHEPGEILNQLRIKIIKALAQEGHSNQKDGMDICLCSFNKKQNEIEFAGANNPLWIVDSNAINEFKGNKMPIGAYVNDQTPFTSHKIKVKKGDRIYLITDGFADQFGGARGKKFKYKPLMELLQKHHNEEMPKQKEILIAVIDDWKKGFEQVDDISIIGIRV